MISQTNRPWARPTRTSRMPPPCSMVFAEALDTPADGDRAQLRELGWCRCDPTEQVVGVFVVLACIPFLVRDDLSMGLPDAFDDRIGCSVRVVGAEHPGGQVTEG